jgi:hypothetical protein
MPESARYHSYPGPAGEEQLPGGIEIHLLPELLEVYHNQKGVLFLSD